MLNEAGETRSGDIDRRPRATGFRTVLAVETIRAAIAIGLLVAPLLILTIIVH
jgi:hypothetical protein